MFTVYGSLKNPSVYVVPDEPQHSTVIPPPDFPLLLNHPPTRLIAHTLTLASTSAQVIPVGIHGVLTGYELLLHSTELRIVPLPQHLVSEILNSQLVKTLLQTPTACTRVCVLLHPHLQLLDSLAYIGLSCGTSDLVASVAFNFVEVIASTKLSVPSVVFETTILSLGRRCLIH